VLEGPGKGCWKEVLCQVGVVGSGEEIVGEEIDEKGDEEYKGDRGVMGEVEEVEGEARRLRRGNGLVEGLP
jgi:hypothetical protein